MIHLLFQLSMIHDFSPVRFWDVILVTFFCFWVQGVLLLMGLFVHLLLFVDYVSYNAPSEHLSDMVVFGRFSISKIRRRNEILVYRSFPVHTIVTIVNYRCIGLPFGLQIDTTVTSKWARIFQWESAFQWEACCPWPLGMDTHHVWIRLLDPSNKVSSQAESQVL